MNAAWHAKHLMPKNATLAQRVKWHTAHAKACGCRPRPKSVRDAMKRSAAAVTSRAGKAPPAGYSGTPLAQKLGFAAGKTILLMAEPPNYAALVGPTLKQMKAAKTLGDDVDFVHLFTANRSALADRLQKCRRALKPDAVIWVSWPKKSSGVTTDITEDTIRDVALPMGFVDVKVCAVDETWSGLKLVLRKELR